jgi:glycosyltransferase involved in cell wall biosynthesis
MADESRRKQILWLCSWYPSENDAFNGDFIQRHAKAASLFNDIYVVHVSTGNSKRPSSISSPVKGLTEKIIYIKKSGTWTGRLKSHYKLLKTYRNAVSAWQKEYGKPHLVHVHVPVWTGKIALWIKRKFQIPFVVTEHWGIYNEIEENNYLRKKPWFKKTTKKVFDKANDIITVSRFLGEGIRKYVAPVNYKIIPNAVDTTLFKNENLQRDGFQFIHVSNMVPLKNAKGILRAFQMAQQKGMHARLLMVGNRDNEILNYSLELGLDKKDVQFTGEILYADVSKKMEESNCLVLFSNIENSPCVIGEALCCGLPVISTPVGGIPELLNERNSRMVERGNESSLANSMIDMVSAYNDFDRNAIAIAATAKFNYETIGKNMNEVYSAI